MEGKVMEKEFLYVGHYVDVEGKFILKIGTTNDLKRRAQEHTRNYRRAKTHTMPATEIFHYDWVRPLSKYNTVRYEDKNRQAWQDLGLWEFIRNDRFYCPRKPDTVEITIKKTYKIALS
jgi:predicted GIY-YIG superfamily endonuclease